MGREASAHSPKRRRTFWCTHELSDMDSTRGACGDVAGVGLGPISPSCTGIPTKLYRLLCELATRCRELAAPGGVFVPLPFNEVRLLCDFDLVEERVVGGEDLSNHELSVDVDLFSAGRSFTSPSLLELPEEPEASVVAASGVAVLKEARDRRRRLRSLRKEGIIAQGRQSRGESEVGGDLRHSAEA